MFTDVVPFSCRARISLTPVHPLCSLFMFVLDVVLRAIMSCSSLLYSTYVSTLSPHHCRILSFVVTSRVMPTSCQILSLCSALVSLCSLVAFMSIHTPLVFRFLRARRFGLYAAPKRLSGLPERSSGERARSATDVIVFSDVPPAMACMILFLVASSTGFPRQRGFHFKTTLVGSNIVIFLPE